MQSRAILLKLGLGLICLWGVVFAVMKFAESQRVTPEAIAAYFDKKPMEGVSDPTERKKVIESLASMVNRLDLEARQSFREGRGNQNARVFFDSLSEEERLYWVDLTIEQHFKAVFNALNQMPKEDLQRMVARIQKDMEKDTAADGDLQRLKEADIELFQNITEKGLSAYYRDASVDVKMELAPVLEKMQERLRGMR